MVSEIDGPGRADDRYVVAAAIVDRTGAVPRLLLARRGYPAEVAGLWELPGGKVEDGESWQQALRREIAEEIGVDIKVAEQVGSPVTLRPALILVALVAEIISGTAHPHEHEALQWVDAEGLADLTDSGGLVPADAAWVPDLVRMLQ